MWFHFMIISLNPHHQDSVWLAIVEVDREMALWNNEMRLARFLNSCFSIKDCRHATKQRRQQYKGDIIPSFRRLLGDDTDLRESFIVVYFPSVEKHYVYQFSGMYFLIIQKME